MSEFEKPLSFSNNLLQLIKENAHVIGLWFFFRVFTTIIVAVTSTIRPITELEQKIALWPPTSPMSIWFDRVFISPWIRWDVLWYSKIILHGYSADDGTANFHPLYPWFGKLLTLLNLNPVFNLLIISSTATLLLLIFFKKLISLDSDHNEKNFTLMIFLVFPTSFILFAPYPESLFLLFSIICIYSLRKRKWLWAGSTAFLAVLTRQQGLLLIFPFIWELWVSSGRKVKYAIKTWWNWLTCGLIPLAYLIWIFYRYYFLDESGIRTGNIQDIIYSTLISPSATMVVPEQKFLLPWNTLYQAFLKIFHSPDIDIWINVIVAFLFIWMLVLGWKNMVTSSRIYSSIIYIVSLSYFTGFVHPLMGLPRHLSLAFPIFRGITPTLSTRKHLIWFYIFFCIVLMSMTLIAYALLAWVP